MGQNFDFKRNVDRFRRRLYRSADGKLLGVFTGIAESLGYRVGRTRAIGVCVLVALAGFFGANGFWVTLLVGGFFYLLTALLMQPPRPAGSRSVEAEHESDLFPLPLAARRWGSNPTASPTTERVDLAQLDRQLESLSRRIQRMEAIVTDRQYDWERRLDR